MGYKRSNIHGTGGEWIENFLEKYDLEFVCKESCEPAIMQNDIEKFKEYLNNFSDKWIAKQNYKVMKEKLERMEKEKEEGYETKYGDRYRSSKDNLENWFSEQCDNYKKSYDSRLEQIQSEYNRELEDLKATNEKWKAMFTKQALANATLTEMIKEYKEC